MERFCNLDILRKKIKQLTKLRTFLIKQLLYNTIVQVLDLQLYFNTNEICKGKYLSVTLQKQNKAKAWFKRKQLLTCRQLETNPWGIMEQNAAK